MYSRKKENIVVNSPFFFFRMKTIVVKTKGKNLTLVCTDDVSDMLLSKEIGTGD